MRLANQFGNYKILHVFNKSIANFRIFYNQNDAQRFLSSLHYYNTSDVKISLSSFLRKNKDYCPSVFYPKDNPILKFIAYCIMPDHYHLLIKISRNTPISKYMSDVENSYSKTFNKKYERKGPLWQSRFKYKVITNNEILLHVSRYIHLNPTTKGLVDKPEDWLFSSYKYYFDDEFLKEMVPEISISKSCLYRKFVENNLDYQKKLKEIKRQILE
jgi:putative transposase